MEYYWPPSLCASTSSVDVDDNAGRFQSPLSKFVRSIARPGARVKLTMTFRNVSNAVRAALQSTLARVSGSDRIWVWDHSYRQRGSMEAPELIEDQLFENLANFSSQTTKFAHTSSDDELRATRISNDGTTAGMVRNTPALTVTPYVPYALRILVVSGRGSSDALSPRAGSTAFGTEYGVLTDLDEGLLTLGFVPYSSTLIVGLSQQAVSTIVGSYVTVPFFSVARCALVDNGGNLLPFSNNYTNAAWSKTRLTIDTTVITTPDGNQNNTSILREDNSASNTHLLEDSVTVSSAQGDYVFTVALKALARTFARIMMIEDTGTHTVSCYINLTTGEITHLDTSGANWSNARAFAKDLGDGFWQASIVARKESAATTLSARVYIAEAANDITFTGLTQNSLIMWRATLKQSSVPGRLFGTGGTADSDGDEQALNGGITTKGWPVSTEGLLLKGDQVQIGDQLLIVEAPVNSDANGQAFLQTKPPFRDAPADETPIIVQRPLGKFMTEESENGWNNLPAFISGAEIVLGEAP